MSKPPIFDKINYDDVVKATKEGYLYVTTDPPHPYGESRKDRKKKYIYLHRAVKEKELGRYLTPDEQVDHKDKDKTNNDPSNLVLVIKGEHQRDHVSRGNHFWKKSPRNKKKKKTASSYMVQRVLFNYLQSKNH
jgi:hypothetical protein